VAAAGGEREELARIVRLPDGTVAAESRRPGGRAARQPLPRCAARTLYTNQKTGMLVTDAWKGLTDLIADSRALGPTHLIR
jgi:hypothetical protein